MNLFTKQKSTHKHRKQTWLPRGIAVAEENINQDKLNKLDKKDKLGVWY